MPSHQIEIAPKNFVFLNSDIQRNGLLVSLEDNTLFLSANDNISIDSHGSACFVKIIDRKSPFPVFGVEVDCAKKVTEVKVTEQEVSFSCNSLADKEQNSTLQAIKFEQVKKEEQVLREQLQINKASDTKVVEHKS
ncbi:hypothetical protein D5R81_00915 [Parashewanella spongiae]|uniref:Uncharacterized protein n=2 Tax=Parashewanella spongiae TaxID=342950 RepID=A0A3A6TY33_9GAMM|nr:hypothetical protein D5R81_00915 [Parashewanella spongiae]